MAGLSLLTYSKVGGERFEAGVSLCVCVGGGRRGGEECVSVFVCAPGGAAAYVMACAR